MKALLLLGLMACAVAHGEPAVKTASGPWGHKKTYTKIYESGRVLAQANMLTTEDMKNGVAGDPGLQIKLGYANSDVLLNLGPRWFIAERDYLFTRSETLPIFGLKIQLEGKQPAREPAEESRRDLSSARWLGFEKK